MPDGPTVDLDTSRFKVLPGCSDKDPDSIPLPQNRNPRCAVFAGDSALYSLEPPIRIP